MKKIQKQLAFQAANWILGEWIPKRPYFYALLEPTQDLQTYTSHILLLPSHMGTDWFVQHGKWRPLNPNPNVRELCVNHSTLCLKKKKSITAMFRKKLRLQVLATAEQRMAEETGLTATKTRKFFRLFEKFEGASFSKATKTLNYLCRILDDWLDRAYSLPLPFQVLHARTSSPGRTLSPSNVPLDDAVEI